MNLKFYNIVIRETKTFRNINIDKCIFKHGKNLCN